jgi:hypothetical protein
MAMINETIKPLKYKLFDLIRQVGPHCSAFYDSGDLWTQDQMIRYIESIFELPNGCFKNIIISNNLTTGEVQCIDGKQQCRAIQKFIDGEISIMNKYGTFNFKFDEVDFSNPLNLKAFSVANTRSRFQIKLNNLINCETINASTTNKKRKY